MYQIAPRTCTPPPGLRPSSISSDYQTSLDRITAAQLLPIAATIVAAGAGAEVAEVLPDPQHALGTLVTSYVMWGMGVPLAMTVLVMYYQRLALHKLPSREVIVSCFLPLGPLGMGGYTIMYLGKVSRQNFAETHVLSDVAGEVVYILGFFVALIMWGFGLVWLVFALAIIYKCKPFPFNMGWWGFTFPLGVFAVSTITFGVEMPSQFFKIFGIVSALPQLGNRSSHTIVADTQRGSHLALDCGCPWNRKRGIHRKALLCSLRCQSQAQGNRWAVFPTS